MYIYLDINVAQVNVSDRIFKPRPTWSKATALQMTLLQVAFTLRRTKLAEIIVLIL